MRINMITSSKSKKKFSALLIASLLTCIAANAKQQPNAAPTATQAEKTQSFKDIPYLESPFLNASPNKNDDEVDVGELGIDGGNKRMITQLANEIADGKHGKFDSLLVAQHGKLLFESYYRRGRIDLPHFQASTTKAYTSLALGRAIELGYLDMSDLDKPIVNYLNGLDPSKFTDGVEKITLFQALTMQSGIRLSDSQKKELNDDLTQLRGLQEIQSYLEQSEAITSESQRFLYQGDPRLVMHVIDANVPGSAQDFIKTELLGKMDITNYRWKDHLSGLPEAGSRSAFTSRSMLKPEEFIARSTSRLLVTGDDEFHYGGKDTSKQGYGFYWWSADLEYDNKRYFTVSAQGGYGQFITLIEELNLLIVHTAHDNDANYLQMTAEKIIPAFIK